MTAQYYAKGFTYSIRQSSQHASLSGRFRFQPVVCDSGCFYKQLQAATDDEIVEKLDGQPNGATFKEALELF
jgi:hypothetical protein